MAHLGLIAISGVSVAGKYHHDHQAIFLALRRSYSVSVQKLGWKIKKTLPTMTESLKVTCCWVLLGGAVIWRWWFLLLDWSSSRAGDLPSLAGGTIVFRIGWPPLGLGSQQSRLLRKVSLLTNLLNALFSCSHFPFWLGHCWCSFGTAGPVWWASSS